MVVQSYTGLLCHSINLVGIFGCLPSGEKKAPFSRISLTTSAVKYMDAQDLFWEEVGVGKLWV
jgi:hypothetical protein